MIEYINHKIKDIISEIKEVEGMIKFHLDGNDPADPIMAEQFRHRKNKLLKELLSELALSGVNFKDMRGFIRRLTTYLEKTDSAASMPKELKSNLAQVEKLMLA
jgi:hypothetical protein